MNFSYRLLSVILLLSLLSSVAICLSPIPDFGDPQNKATRWFQSEYTSFLGQDLGNAIPPSIFGVSVTPSALKYGDPSAEINAIVYDPVGIRMVYAEVDNRMNLMLDLKMNGRYTGYCNSNLPPGTYRVTIVAIDKAGNAARTDAASNLTIRDPRDLNGDHIDDSLDIHSSKEQRVIVLHDGNISGFGPAQTLDNFKVLPASAMILPGNKLTELSKQNGVKGIYEDQKLKVLSAPEDDNDYGFQDYSSGKSNYDPRKDQKNLMGDGVTIALIDTGADSNHEALAGKIVAFKDFVNNKTTPYDDNGHGTHCASLIAGRGDVGVAPGSNLVVVKVMDKDGSCYLSDAIKALDWCLENKNRYGIKIISFSVGGDIPSGGTSLLDDACNRVVEQGLVMCVAAGNSGPSPGSIVIPGDAENVITVGAIDDSGLILDKSSRGPLSDGEIKPDLVTLGVDVVSALAGSKDGYSYMSGTSMAVPQVAGAAAVLLEAQPDLKPADVKRILLKSADNLGQPVPDNTYGYGALNITSALEAINIQPNWLAGAKLERIDLSRYNATVGDSVFIEAKVSGDVKDVVSQIVGPDKTMEIPLDDFDHNGIYSNPWDTSFSKPGNYQVEVNLTGTYGEMTSSSVPFRLDPKH
ncbi:MAG: S8 family peptidase [Methanotrichaceae archaeon]